MSYQSQREKIIEFFEKRIMPSMRERSLLDQYYNIDYRKTINLIAGEIGSSESMVMEVVETLIRSEKLVETRNLSIPKNEIEKLKLEESKKVEEEVKEAGL